MYSYPSCSHHWKSVRGVQDKKRGDSNCQHQVDILEKLERIFLEAEDLQGKEKQILLEDPEGQMHVEVEDRIPKPLPATFPPPAQPPTS